MPNPFAMKITPDTETCQLIPFWNKQSKIALANSQIYRL